MEVVKFYVVSAVGYILGILFFWKFIMVEYIDYASTTVASLKDLYATADFNYKRYIVYFLNDFKPEWLAVAFLICVCFLWRSVLQSRQNKVATLILVPIAMLIVFLLSFGVYPFLTSPLFVPRAMYGVGCFIAFLGIFASTEVPKGYIAKFACLILGWYFFVFSFTYGNALNVQAKYTDYRITEVIDDLVECRELSDEGDVVLQITGTIGYAPSFEGMLEHFPLLEKLVPVTFQGNSLWGDYGIRAYYGLPGFARAGTYEPPTGEFSTVTDNYLHTIRVRENFIWVELNLTCWFVRQ